LLTATVEVLNFAQQNERSSPNEPKSNMAWQMCGHAIIGQ